MTEVLPADQGSPTPAEAQPEAAPEVSENAPEAEAQDAPTEGGGTLLSEGAGEGEPKADEAAPTEEVADFGELKVPEGATFDEKHVESLKEFAQAEGFTPAQAAKLIERDARLQAESAEAEKAAWAKNVAQLREEAQADPDIGGEQMKATVQNARATLAKYDTDGQVAAFLERSGLGNDKGVLGFLARIGTALAEPNSLVDGDEAAEPRVVTDRDIFSNSPGMWREQPIPLG